MPRAQKSPGIDELYAALEAVAPELEATARVFLLGAVGADA